MLFDKPVCEDVPHWQTLQFPRRLSSALLGVSLSTITLSIRKCSLPRTFATAIPWRFMQKCFQITMGKRLFTRSYACSPAIITAFPQPPKKARRELLFTATVGEQRRQSHSPRSWGRTIFQYCSPSKSILLLSLDKVDQRFLRTWPAR